MSRITTILFLALLCCSFSATRCAAQSTELTVTVLAPCSTYYEPALEEEYIEANHTIDKIIKPAVVSQTPMHLEDNDNNEALTRSINVLLPDSLNAFTLVPVFTAFTATEKFFPGLKPAVLFKNVKCNGEINNLRQAAQQHNSNFIINFPYIRYIREGDKVIGVFKVQVYDRLLDSVLLEKEYSNRNKVDSSSTRTDLELGKIMAAIGEGYDNAITEIPEAILSNSPLLKKLKKLEEDRHAVLLNDFYKKDYDKHFLDSILPAFENVNVSSSLFQLLTDESKTKFVAFVYEEINYSDSTAAFIDTTGYYYYPMDSVYPPVVTPDTGYYEAPVPVLSSYCNKLIIAGVMENGKWYYDVKEKVIYGSECDEEGKQRLFEILGNTYFFKDGTTEFNPRFWETGWFKKIKYPADTNSFAKNNREYWLKWKNENMGFIGRYEIAALSAGKIDDAAHSVFLQDVTEKTAALTVVLRKKIGKKKDIYLNTYLLRYSFEKDIILIPAMIRGRKGEIEDLKFYVMFPKDNSVYEWNYIKLKSEGKGESKESSQMVQYMSAMIELTHSYEVSGVIFDRAFWNTYVLAKEGQKYKYLKEVK